MIAGLYAVPLGEDFPRTVLSALSARSDPQRPEALARTTLLVNTARMRRRINTLFDDGPACLLPRIYTVEQLSALSASPPSHGSLTRRIELAHLIEAARESTSGVFETAQRFALADSLAELLDEMEGEGLSAAKLTELEGLELSQHWSETQTFVAIAAQYQQALGGISGKAGRLRKAIENFDTALPAANPVVLAGSTGSRGATLVLMTKLLQRDNGAVVLPGFDPYLTPDDWEAIAASANWEDHAQARFVRLAHHLGWPARELPERVQLLDGEVSPAISARSKLISLALRPAPVTDQWLEKGPALRNLAKACADVTLLQASNVRDEAMAIALGVRAALERRKRVAIITPDRQLTRRVTAQLLRWNIIPDDSAGIPLSLTAMGRLTRQVMECAAAPLDMAQLLSALKHPLCHSGGARGKHNVTTRQFELWLRRRNDMRPTVQSIEAWGEDNDCQAWVAWVIQSLLRPMGQHANISGWANEHRERLNALMLGSEPDGSKLAWEDDAGEAIAELFTELLQAEIEAPEAAILTIAQDYMALFSQALQGREIRRTIATRSDIAIWGTLEARAQGVDIAILAGLTEGVWPSLPEADPWLNRSLRKAIGLPAPERRVGLQAHDFQQAALAPEVWLCRPLRDDEADTIASRWLMRLTGLLDGLPENGGREALAGMMERGAYWLAMAQNLDRPQPALPASRPCPVPPPQHRPRTLSATDLQRFRRDPYAIYAKRVLRLYPLKPLRADPDAAARGTALHAVFETAFASDMPHNPAAFAQHLQNAADQVFEAMEGWPLAKLVWRQRVRRLSAEFADLHFSRPLAETHQLEVSGALQLPDQIRLTAKADRVDIGPDGRAWLIDYKTGDPPSPKQRAEFDPQLPVMGWMLEQGGFATLGPRKLNGLSYIKLGTSDVKWVDVPLDEMNDMATKLAKITALLMDEQMGFAARIMPRVLTDLGDYDHLARFGEWDMTDIPVKEPLS